MLTREDVFNRPWAYVDRGPGEPGLLVITFYMLRWTETPVLWSDPEHEAIYGENP